MASKGGAAGGGPKRISQATFEEAVAEGVEEFGLSRPEAVDDAVAQFTAAGVDLANIVIDRDALANGGDGSGAAAHPAVAAARALERTNADGALGAELDAALAAVAAAVTGGPPEQLAAARAIAGSNGGVDAVCGSLRRLDAAAGEFSADGGAATAASLALAADALRALTAGSDENRHRAPSDITDLLARGIVRAAGVGHEGGADGGGSSSTTDAASAAVVRMQRAFLGAACSLAVKREGVKEGLWTGGAVTGGALATIAAAVGLPYKGGEGPAVAGTRGAALPAVTPAERSAAIAAAAAGGGGGGLASPSPAAPLPPLPPLSAPALARLRSCCALVAAVLRDDDLDALAPSAYEHARALAGAHAATDVLLRCLEAATAAQDAACATEASVALQAVVVNDEICRDVEGRLGGVGRLCACLAPHVLLSPPHEGDADAAASAATSAAAAAAASPVPRLVRAGLAVLRSLAYSDTVRARMCEAPSAAAAAAATSAAAPRPPPPSALAVIVAALAAPPPVGSSPGVAEAALGCLANLSLRPEANKAAITAAGGLALIAAGMRAHPTVLGVQRAGCLAARNLVSRSPERRAAAFDEGLEPLLQAAYGRHPGARDVAYACLRDMGVDYAETLTGRAQAERAARALAAGDITVQ